MTVIVRLGLKRYPTLLGDILISALGAERPCQVPTSLDLSPLFPDASESMPFKLCQKLAVVGDSLAVGWAGKLNVAKNIVGELRRRHLESSFDRSTLISYFDSLPSSVWDDIGLVGFIRDDRGIAAFQCDRTILFKTDLLGPVAVLGSGADRLRKELEAVAELPYSIDAAPDEASVALAFSLQLSGVLLTFEGAFQDSFKELYGAGYEIVGLFGESLAKLDDIAYIFWTAHVLPDGSVSIDAVPQALCRYAYNQDLLVIRSVLLHPAASQFDRIFVVPPVYRDVSAIERSSVAPPQLNARWLCNYFLVRTQGTEIAAFAFVLGRSDVSERRFVHFIENGNIGCCVNRGFLSMVAREITQTFALSNGTPVHTV